jgi:hypothetical protein
MSDHLHVNEAICLGLTAASPQLTDTVNM